MFRHVCVSFLCSLCVLPIVFTYIQITEAQVMSSGSYRIQSDSINFGGGRSTSTNFTAESTFGEIATGDATSTSFELGAGFQQLQEVFISLTGSAPVSLEPEIGGVTGGDAYGSTTVTVITDSPGGYSLTISYDSLPAMVSGGNSIADYVSVGSADFSFIYGADDAVFGFSPTGLNVVQRFKDNGASCDVDGDSTTETCWVGATTTPTVLAQGVGSNHPSGATTTIYFQVGVGSSALQAPGIYIATTTITALAL